MHAGIATFPLMSTFEYKCMEIFSFIKHFNVFFKITNQFVTLIQWRKMISLKGVDVFDGGEIVA